MQKKHNSKFEIHSSKTATVSPRSWCISPPSSNATISASPSVASATVITPHFGVLL